jgi:hypothetical protein
MSEIILEEIVIALKEYGRVAGYFLLMAVALLAGAVASNSLTLGWAIGAFVWPLLIFSAIFLLYLAERVYRRLRNR